MTNLATLDESKFTPDQMTLNKDLLYDLNMGYIDLKNLVPGHSILYHEQENEYSHNWSYEAIAEQYWYHKLNEFMTMTDYLNLPAFIVKKLLRGSAKGKEERAKYDEAKRKEAKALKDNQFKDTSNPNMPEMDPLLQKALADAAEELASRQ